MMREEKDYFTSKQRLVSQGEAGGVRKNLPQQVGFEPGLLVHSLIF